VSALGAGRKTAELRNRIEQLRSEIASLGSTPEDMPEMIEASNLLRKSEHLLKSDSLKTDLIASYDEYVAHLESLLRSVFEIQNELKGVLREQSRLIADGSKPRPGRAAKRARR